MLEGKRSLRSLVRVVDYQHDAMWDGPDREAVCPCGSRRRARSCHAAADGSWIASISEPLLSDSPTGLSQPGCYGGAAADCSPGLTREHWISAGVQRALSDDRQYPLISGAPWLTGGTREISVKALASRVLCERHNQSMSRLDALGERFFRYLRDDQIALASGEDTDVERDTFTLLSGPDLELWLLKIFWGGLAAKAWGQHGHTINALKSELDPATLARILWRGAEWPSRWGLHSRYHPVDEQASPNSVAAVPWSDGVGSLWGGVIQFGAVHLSLALGEPDGAALVRPSHFALRRRGFRGEKVFALAWPEAGHPSVTYTRTT